jgi:hypothetical protein
VANLAIGDVVDIDWGLSTIMGTVVRIYGAPSRIQVTVELTPELSSYVVDEPTTVTVPRGAVRRHSVVA